MCNLFKWLFQVNQEREGKLKKQYGLKPDWNDERDFVVTYSDDKLPLFYVLPIFGEIKNQLNLNSCGSHAMATAMENKYKLENHRMNGVSLSEMYHYFWTRVDNITYPNDEGMTMREMLSTVRDRGICPEKLYPYDVSKFNEEPSYFTNSFARWAKIKYYYRLMDLESVKRTIYNHDFVLLGLYVNNSFRKNTGSITVSDGEILYGGHAIVCYGYDDEHLYCENSWGDNYKTNGRMIIPHEYYNKYCFDAWTFSL